MSKSSPKKIKSLKKLAFDKLSDTSLFNAMPNSELKNALIKEKKIKNTYIDKENENEMNAMLTEINRLRDFVEHLLNINDDDNPNFIENIIDDPYNHYFARYCVMIKHRYSYHIMSDELIDSIRNIDNSFIDFLQDQYDNNDMFFVGIVLTDIEEFGQFQNAFEQLNDLLADFIFERDDRLLNFFNIAFEKKYLKVLSSLKDFHEYLGHIAVIKNDAYAFENIKTLYCDHIASHLTLYNDNTALFQQLEKDLINQRSIRQNVKAELLQRVPLLEGGGSNNLLCGVTIVLSALIMGVSSIM